MPAIVQDVVLVPRPIRLTIWLTALSVFLFVVIGRLDELHVGQPFPLMDLLEVGLQKGVQVEMAGEPGTLTSSTKSLCDIQTCGTVRLKIGSPSPVLLHLGNRFIAENWTVVFGVGGAKVVRDDGTPVVFKDVRNRKKTRAI